jgi:hypothetical protein
MQDSAIPTPSATKRKLTIRSVPDGFIFSTSTNLPASMGSSDLFETFVEDQGWAHCDNLTVTIIDFSNRFMLLPSDMTDEEDIRSFFQFQYPQDTNYQLYTIPIDEKQTFCWEIPVIRDEQFERLFPDRSLLASCYLLADWTYRQATKSTVLTAHFYGNVLHLFVAASGKLLFANTFPVNNMEEGLYFLLRCIAQLEIDPHKTLAYLHSESTPTEMWSQQLEPYLANICFFELTLQPDQPVRIVQPNTTSPNENC